MFSVFNRIQKISLWYFRKMSFNQTSVQKRLARNLRDWYQNVKFPKVIFHKKLWSSAPTKIKRRADQIAMKWTSFFQLCIFINTKSLKYIFHHHRRYILCFFHLSFSFLILTPFQVALRFAHNIFTFLFLISVRTKRVFFLWI